MRAGLDKKPRDVASMFDDVARRYDLVNSVLSLGQDRGWRAKTTESLALSPGDRVLDVAAGTATSTAHLATTGATCVATDFSLGMLRNGADKGVPRIAADALRLPFADASFDAVTISFGLRNIVDTDAALTEMLRVTKPGGRLTVCEFSTPTWTPFRVVYLNYLMRAMPMIVERISSNPDSYVYLAESIRAWPDQQALADRITAAGWTNVAWRNLTFGVVALHRAVKPAH